MRQPSKSGAYSFIDSRRRKSSGSHLKKSRRWLHLRSSKTTCRVAGSKYSRKKTALNGWRASKRRRGHGIRWQAWKRGSSFKFDNLLTLTTLHVRIEGSLIAFKKLRKCYHKHHSSKPEQKLLKICQKSYRSLVKLPLNWTQVKPWATFSRASSSRDEMLNDQAGQTQLLSNSVRLWRLGCKSGAQNLRRKRLALSIKSWDLKIGLPHSTPAGTISSVRRQTSSSRALASSRATLSRSLVR